MAWTLPEVVVTALATLSSMLISVAFISATTAAMQTMDAKNLGRRQRMEEIAQYLAFKKVPTHIVSKILDFYEYYDSVFQRAGEFSQLPFDLAMTLNVHLYKELLRKCPVFYNISTEAMLQLLSEMRMSVATPYHIVVHEGQPNHNLYFIHRGHVRVWKNFDDDQRRQQLVTLTIGDFFGEGTLLEHLEGRKGVATATVECASFVELLTLTRESLERVLVEHHHDAKVRRRCTAHPPAATAAAAVAAHPSHRPPPPHPTRAALRGAASRGRRCYTSPRRCATTPRRTTGGTRRPTCSRHRAPRRAAARRSRGTSRVASARGATRTRRAARPRAAAPKAATRRRRRAPAEGSCPSGRWCGVHRASRVPTHATRT